MTDNIYITECPRDAMQGWPHFIPTATKVAYINQLLEVGFDILDCGSFVSPKAIPQMADTAEVLKAINPSGQTDLLAIVANLRGAEAAIGFEQLTYLGFPFSISETFQKRNTNKTIEESLAQVADIQNLCIKNGKRLMIYISMGFGNPYEDLYTGELATGWVKKLSELGIEHFSMSDTVGMANPETITYIFNHLNAAFPHLKIGAHFHSEPATRIEKLESAWDSGCRRFDSAINGIGGCPMAHDDLVGNMATETVMQWCDNKGIPLRLNREAFQKALIMASEVFV